MEMEELRVWWREGLWDSFADTAFFLGLGEGLSFTFLVMMMIFLFNPGL